MEVEDYFIDDPRLEEDRRAIEEFSHLSPEEQDRLLNYEEDSKPDSTPRMEWPEDGCPISCVSTPIQELMMVGHIGCNRHTSSKPALWMQEDSNWHSE